MSSTTLFRRRHFEWLATFAREFLVKGDRENLADELAKTNPAFDRQKFLDWSTPESEKRAAVIAAPYTHSEAVEARRLANRPW